MNKLVIPSILLATVMVAGMFAFAPIEQASTVHTEIVSLVSGASATVSETVTAALAIGDSEISFVILSSTVPFTIQEIEIEVTMPSAFVDASDALKFNGVAAYPAEYASTEAGVIAANGDGYLYNLSSAQETSILLGDDDFNTITTSFNAIQGGNAFDDLAVLSDLVFGPNTKIVIELAAAESGSNQAGDISSLVTFYLSGPEASDITLTGIDEIAGSTQLVSP